MIARRIRHDMIDSRERPDIAEPTHSTDPTENAETAEPIEPTDMTEPTDPTQSRESCEQIESVDASDRIDHLEVPVDSVTPLIVPQGRQIMATLGFTRAGGQS